MDLSIVIPAYNEEESLPELISWITQSIKDLNLNYEIIVIDDGSRDSTPSVIRNLKKEYPSLKAVIFRKNYGKSAALSEGFNFAKGKLVITMDADLQDDPEEIPEMINKLNDGYDLISGWKKKRRDPISKKLPSRLFNLVTSILAGIKLHDFNCGLKAYKREVIENIQVYGEMHRFLPVLAHWQGFKVGEIPVKHHPRVYGNTKFGIRRFFTGFLDLITVLFLTRYRTSPLHIFGMLGLFVFLIGFVIEAYFTVLWFMGGTIGTRPLFFLGILLIIVGIQFIVFGLLGEMLSADFAEKVKYSYKEIIE